MLQLELSVNKVKIDENHPMSLNPFAAGLKVLDQLEALKPQESIEQTQWLSTAARQPCLRKPIRKSLRKEDNDSGHRDILGEMLLAALVMITGGEPKEEARIRRSDRLLIMEAIILAAKAGREAGKSK